MGWSSDIWRFTDRKEAKVTITGIMHTGDPRAPRGGLIYRPGLPDDFERWVFTADEIREAVEWLIKHGRGKRT